MLEVLHRVRASRCSRPRSLPERRRAEAEASIYDAFTERALERIAKIKQGHPLDPTTMIGAQVSTAQLEKIAGYVDIGEQEGPSC